MLTSCQLPPWLRVHNSGAVIDLLVQPRASKNEVCGVIENRLKVRLTSPPVEGAANKLCCSFIAKKLKIAKSNVTVLSGEKSRQKRLLVEGLSAEEVHKRLGELLVD